MKSLFILLDDKFAVGEIWYHINNKKHKVMIEESTPTGVSIRHLDKDTGQIMPHTNKLSLYTFTTFYNRIYS